MRWWCDSDLAVKRQPLAARLSLLAIWLAPFVLVELGL